MSTDNYHALGERPMSILESGFEELRASMEARRGSGDATPAQREAAQAAAYDTPDEMWPERPAVQHLRLGDDGNDNLTAELAIPCTRCSNGYNGVEYDEHGYRYNARCRCWEWRRRARNLTTLTGLPGSAARASFDAFDWHGITGRLVEHNGRPSLAVLQDEINRVRVGGFRRELRKGLLLYGNTGRGKTHLTQAIAASLVVDQDVRVNWRHWPEWLERFKSAMGSRSQETTKDVIKDLLSAPVVILDEIGGERVTDFARAQLDLMLTKLGNKGVTLLVTSNFGYDELVEQIGARSVSRLTELCEIVHVHSEGGDWRRKA